MQNRENIVIRHAQDGDVDAIAGLISRLKKLNEEFDPLLKTRADLTAKAKEYVKRSLQTDSSIVLVADYKGKVVGVIKADLVERLFYEPSNVLVISDLYVMPEFRRKGLGEKLINKLGEKVKGKINMLMAEFPSLNRIAIDFYNKVGFRAMTNIYVKKFE